MTTRDFFRLLDVLEAMIKTPELRPDDGSTEAFRAYLKGQIDSEQIETDHLSEIVFNNMSAMLRHLRSESLLRYDHAPSGVDDWDILAREYRPDQCPWVTLRTAAITLRSNAWGLAHSQGGTRDLIKG